MRKKDKIKNLEGQVRLLWAFTQELDERLSKIGDKPVQASNNIDNPEELRDNVLTDISKLIDELSYEQGYISVYVEDAKEYIKKDEDISAAIDDLYTALCNVEGLEDYEINEGIEAAVIDIKLIADRFDIAL